MGGRAGLARRRRARRRPGHDLHRPERVRRALRPGRVPRPTSTRSFRSCFSGSPATSTTRPATSRCSPSARSPAATPAMPSPSTELSLQTLLDERDFTAASLLLNVLGEGTFLDLLRFVDTARARRRDAPRPRALLTATSAATCTSASRTSAARSATTLTCGRDARRAPPRPARPSSSASPASHPVFIEALTVMSARSLQPAELGRGRVARARLIADHGAQPHPAPAACGFDEAIARHISDLHTPNLM